MQSQPTSTAPATSPHAPSPAPKVVQRTPAKPSGRRPFWIVGLLLIAAIAAGVVYWQKRAATSQQASAAMRSVRSARVATGGLVATIRLSGATGAENFASLITPQLRGSRSGLGRDRQSVQTAAAVPSLSGGSAAAGSSSAPASGTTPTSSSSSSATPGAASSNMSSALRASTSRVGVTPAAPSPPASTSSTSATPSATMGADGTGSTAAAIPGAGGGGGGGGGDFMLVLQKLVKPGSHVKKGEVVAEFDRQYMLMRLDDYRASVIQTNASLLKLKADLAITRHAHKQSIDKAKGILEKARLDMKTIPVLSAIDAERAKLAVAEAEARYKELVGEATLVETSLQSQIRNAEIDLQQTNIELKRAETNADRMIIKSPIDGLTVMQTIPRGGDLAQVQEGDQLWPGIFFMSVVDTRSMIVNATVSQADVEKLRIGSKATVRFDAYPDLVLPARVFSVGGLAKPGGQRATFVKEIPVKLKLERTDPRVIPDLSVSADVVIASETENVSIAPLGSIFQDGSSGAPYVFVQTPDGWTRREVQLGLANYISVAVKSGLNANDVIALDHPPEPNQKASVQ
jgi:HlyD family secretion protein